MTTEQEPVISDTRNAFYQLVFDQAKASNKSIEEREETIVDYAESNQISNNDLNTALLLFRSYTDTVETPVAHEGTETTKMNIVSAQHNTSTPYKEIFDELNANIENSKNCCENPETVVFEREDRLKKELLVNTAVWTVATVGGILIGYGLKAQKNR